VEGWGKANKKGTKSGRERTVKSAGGISKYVIENSAPVTGGRGKKKRTRDPDPEGRQRLERGGPESRGKLDPLPEERAPYGRIGNRGAERKKYVLEAKKQKEKRRSQKELGRGTQGPCRGGRGGGLPGSASDWGGTPDPQGRGFLRGGGRQRTVTKKKKG